MPLMWQKSFGHAGRTFEVVAETFQDPSYLEVVILEGGSLLRVPYPGGVLGLPAYGVTFEDVVDEKCKPAAEALMALAEADIKRRL
jgi:hypothetical protein